MPEPRKLMCILAHPDDESLGFGGTLAKYAREGVETYVATATRGERGRYGDAAQSPGLEVVGQAREAELRAAAGVLGVKEVTLLGYLDGDVDRADPEDIIPKIAGHLRRVRPQVVATFGPDGAYGHPDHIAISQYTTAACTLAADASFASTVPDDTPHRVSKLYYLAWPTDKWKVYQAAFKQLRTTVDGVHRQATPWPDWAVTTLIDTAAYWPTVWEAVRCHKTQLSIYGKLADLDDAYHELLWGSQEFYRAFSLVNGGRTRETDLFAGIG